MKIGVKVKNAKYSPIVTQESLGFSFQTSDMVYGAGVFTANQLSKPVQDRLQKATPESLFIDFDANLREWIVNRGSTADKAILNDLEVIERHELKKFEQKTIQEKQAADKNRLEKIKMLTEVSGAFTGAANFAAALNNDHLATFLGAGAGFASFGAGVTTGLSFTGAGLVFTGAAMLVTAFSRRKKGDAGLGKALQAMFQKLAKIEKDLFEFRQLMIQMNYAMFQGIIADFAQVHQELRLVIKQLYHQQYDVNMIRQAVDLVLENQYEQTLIGANNYGEDRRTRLSLLTQEQYNGVLREYIPKLKQIIQVAFKDYHSGAALYAQERAGYKDETLNDIAQVYKKGQALRYFALNYREHGITLSSACDHLPNLVLWQEAAEHMYRLNAFYSQDDLDGADLQELIAQGDELLQCIQSMQTLKNALFRGIAVI